MTNDNQMLSIIDELKLTREELFKFERYMWAQEQAELKVEHFFSPGIYTRVLYIPKGCMLTGKIHKEPILNIMMKGDISVLLGDRVVRVQAPFMGVSPAGSKKIGYAHEDTVWMGCHGTDETDLAKIEARFVTNDEQEFLFKDANVSQYELELTKCG